MSCSSGNKRVSSADLPHKVVANEGSQHSKDVPDSCEPATSNRVVVKTSALIWREFSFTWEALNQALITFCRAGSVRVKELVRIGANIEHQDEHGNTPLMICAENCSMEILDYLVYKHANVNAVNHAGDTALILSVSGNKRTEVTRFLLKQKDVDLHHENQQGQTALNKATYLLDIDTMRLLLEESMRRNPIRRNVVKIGHHTNSCFFNNRCQEVKQNFTATETGLRVLYEMLKRHVISGESPLQQAIDAGDLESFRNFLTLSFPSEELQKRYIDTALMYMFEDSCHKIGERFSTADIIFINLLLQYNADVNQDNGSTLISLAVESGNYQVVELLCTHGANVDTFPSNQQDPLDIAARNGRFDLFELLLKHKYKTEPDWDFLNLPS